MLLGTQTAELFFYILARKLKKTFSVILCYVILCAISKTKINKENCFIKIFGKGLGQNGA